MRSLVLNEQNVCDFVDILIYHNKLVFVIFKFPVVLDYTSVQLCLNHNNIAIGLPSDC